jgi:nicotinate-nucleotide adenylyltransferase
VQRGILGGTFDPPHIAHLIAGEAAYRQLGLDVVTFVPAGAPWQKADRAVSDAEHRWKMTSLAIEGTSYFDADDREVRRDGWTYTIDTLDTFSDDEITLILGADAARGLPTWRRGDEILTRSRIAVMERSGVDQREVEAVVGPDLVWLDAPLMELSGTMLRARRRRGGSLRFLVPDPVWEYIEDHRLYGDA